jgi:hypothetical protein
MLTQDQKDSLLQLIDKCEDLPLKNLISAASNQWINGNVSPRRNSFGVKVINGKYDTTDQHCCLITASMFGEKSSLDSQISEHRSLMEWSKLTKNLKYDTVVKFNIPIREINRIVNLFDGETPDSDSDSTGLIIRELCEILFL